LRCRCSSGTLALMKYRFLLLLVLSWVTSASAAEVTAVTEPTPNPGADFAANDHARGQRSLDGLGHRTTEARPEREVPVP